MTWRISAAYAGTDTISLVTDNWGVARATLQAWLEERVQELTPQGVANVVTAVDVGLAKLDETGVEGMHRPLRGRLLLMWSAEAKS